MKQRTRWVRTTADHLQARRSFLSYLHLERPGRRSPMVGAPGRKDSDSRSLRCAKMRMKTRGSEVLGAALDDKCSPLTGNYSLQQYVFELFIASTSTHSWSFRVETVHVRYGSTACIDRVGDWPGAPNLEDWPFATRLRERATWGFSHTPNSRVSMPKSTQTRLVWDCQSGLPPH